jgi:hypothetical protein
VITGNNNGIVYANKRAEMWGAMRDWLPYGSLGEDPELHADLTGLEYGYTTREGVDALILERKEDMKKRGLASPDDGDALALTFAYPVLPQEPDRHRGSLHRSDYDPYREFRGGEDRSSDYDPFAPLQPRRGMRL